MWRSSRAVVAVRWERRSVSRVSGGMMVAAAGEVEGLVVEVGILVVVFVGVSVDVLGRMYLGGRSIGRRCL